MPKNISSLLLNNIFFTELLMIPYPRNSKYAHIWHWFSFKLQKLQRASYQCYSHISPMLHWHRNQPFDFNWKSIDWFLCEYNIGLIWVKNDEARKLQASKWQWSATYFFNRINFDHFQALTCLTKVVLHWGNEDKIYFLIFNFIVC